MIHVCKHENMLTDSLFLCRSLTKESVLDPLIFNLCDISITYSEKCIFAGNIALDFEIIIKKDLKTLKNDFVPLVLIKPRYQDNFNP